MASYASLALIEPESEVAPNLAEAATYLNTLVERDAMNGATGAALDALLAAARDAERRLAAQEARIRQLASLSVTDELTGLLNRRGFQIELRRALARARRSGETGLLMICDLDRFKAVNDTYGHPAGDAAIEALGRMLQAAVRTSDAVARLGGDEFAILLTDVDETAVGGRLMELEHALSGIMLEHGGRHIPLSASVGHAVYGPGCEPEALIARADKALYQAKGNRFHPTLADGAHET